VSRQRSRRRRWERTPKTGSEMAKICSRLTSLEAGATIDPASRDKAFPLSITTLYSCQATHAFDQELRMTTGKTGASGRNWLRSENSDGQGVWQGGFCAQHGWSLSAMGRRSADELCDKRVARRIETSGCGPLAARQRRGASSVLDWGPRRISQALESRVGSWTPRRATEQRRRSP
jgi:hypothetical protein